MKQLYIWFFYRHLEGAKQDLEDRDGKQNEVLIIQREMVSDLLHLRHTQDYGPRWEIKSCVEFWAPHYKKGHGGTRTFLEKGNKYGESLGA